MKQERFSEEKVVGILREAEKGDKPIADLCREHGIVEQRFCRWRRKYGGLDTSDVQRLKELTSENARLKHLLAERDLEVDALEELLAEKWSARSCGDRGSWAGLCRLHFLPLLPMMRSGAQPGASPAWALDRSLLPQPIGSEGGCLLAGVDCDDEHCPGVE